MFELIARRNCDVYGVKYPFNSRFTVSDPIIVLNGDGFDIVKAYRRNPEPVKGKKIIIHQNGVARVGGMETLLLNLSSEYPSADVSFYYGNADKYIIVELSKNWNCIQYNGEELKADIIVSMSCDSDDVIIDRCNADKLYSFFGHQDWRAFKEIKKNEKYWKGFQPTVRQKVTKALSVSEASKNGLKEVWDIDSEVVPNLLVKPEKTLKLFSATRLSPDKGTDNLIYMIEELVASGKPFVWFIAGGNQADPDTMKRLESYPQVVFIQANTNAKWLVEMCDWCVVTSQAESFCYSAYEALMCNVPVVMLECEQAHAIIHNGFNGYIFRQDLEDFNVDKLYKKPKIDKTTVSNVMGESKEKWNKIMKGEL